MVDGLIGRKVGMTQAFDAVGNAVPLTVIKAGPCTVIQRKTKAKDGYDAFQMGLVEDKPARKPSKAQQGHFVKSGSPVLRILREFPVKGEGKEGDQIFVDIFEAGQKVHITGVGKGKGFQGVVKRHHFKGGGGAHGSMFHRAPGSIGASSYPSRVILGMRMGGRMGSDTVTVRNLRVFEADRTNNLLMVEGAVPGANGTVVVIVKA
ncbi:MAG: 50S ribosomal protein L3 [Acidobacteriota bacterium]|nr:50S ribosomal protein L3 [Acidobacteriota bacterium]